MRGPLGAGRLGEAWRPRGAQRTAEALPAQEGRVSGGEGRRPSSGPSPQGCRGEVPASPRGSQTLSEVGFGHPVTWAASWEKPQFPCSWSARSSGSGLRSEPGMVRELQEEWLCSPGQARPTFGPQGLGVGVSGRVSKPTCGVQQGLRGQEHADGLGASLHNLELLCLGQRREAGGPCEPAKAREGDAHRDTARDRRPEAGCPTSRRSTPLWSV